MPERNIPISQREIYTPNKITLFLWWLSTAENELLSDSIVDRNRFKIIGTTVLTTWLFATLAWTYFFSTIIENSILSILLGLFMGFVILTIDRALIKGISKFNKNKITPLLLRSLMALTIGIFMAQPALLFMFNKEIRTQILIDNDQRKSEKNKALNIFYKEKKNELIAQKKGWQDELDKKNDAVTVARDLFISETDGSGGTGKIGIKNIALAKKNEYDKLDSEMKTLIAANQVKINKAEKQLENINDNIINDENLFAGSFNNGFLTRIEALNNLIKISPALQFRYYLLVIILMLIEVMPVLAKIMLPSGIYDEKVRLREEMENEIIRLNINNESELKQHYSNAAKEFDKESINLFFAIVNHEKSNKIKSYSDEWASNHEQSLDGLWARMKKDVMTKHEN